MATTEQKSEPATLEVVLYLDVPPGEFLGTCCVSQAGQACDKILGWKRYKITVRIPDPAGVDGEVAAETVEEI